MESFGLSEHSHCCCWRWLRNDLHSCDVSFFFHVSLFFTFVLLVSRIASLSFDVRSEKCISMKNLSSFTPRQAHNSHFSLSLLHNNNKTSTKSDLWDFFFEFRRFQLLSFVYCEQREAKSEFHRIQLDAWSSLREASKIKRATHNAQLQFIN